MTIRWSTAFLDVDARSQARAEEFWAAVTDSTLSSRRGPDGEFVTLVPASGDAYLRLQRVRSGPGGVHLDLHADDPDDLARRALELGASADLPHPDLPRLGLRSPGGFSWCAVPWNGEAVVPPPVAVPGGGEARLDQIALDIPADRWAAEVAFWTTLTGWTLTPSARYPEFSFLTAPGPAPLRLLLQRLGGAFRSGPWAPGLRRR